MNTFVFVRPRALGLGVLAVALTVAACGSSTSSGSSGSGGSAGSGSSSTSASTAGSRGGAYDAAVAATTQAIKGTFKNVDPASRPAAEDKSIVVISAGQAGDSSKIPSDAAVAAAKAIGWKVTLYDAKLNPANFSPLVNQAVASGASGIIVDAIDCGAAQTAFQQANAKGIPVVAMAAFDCTDPLAGNAKTGVFSPGINYGLPGSDAAFDRSQGVNDANYIIASTHNSAKVMDVEDNEFVGLNYISQGFVGQLKASGGSKVADVVKITAADLGSGKLPAIIQAALLRHPEANWIKSPYGAATLAGIEPALGGNPHHISVLGSEGSAAELDLMRKGLLTGVDATSFPWFGWAAVDSLNSDFHGQKPLVSGIGLQMIDAKHNLPNSSGFSAPIDFISAYKTAWGVS